MRFRLVIGFINHLVVVTTVNYYITDFHTTKHSSPISSVYLHWSSRIYNAGTIKVTQNHKLAIPLHSSTHKVFKSHVKSSQVDFLYSSLLLIPICSELTAHGSHDTAAEQTWTYSKHISCDHYPASLLAHQCDLQKTQIPLLLCVGLCLQISFLATCWLNLLTVVFSVIMKMNMWGNDCGRNSSKTFEDIRRSGNWWRWHDQT
jgi:hypothetical protein